jgi:hypothetical protein
MFRFTYTETQTTEAPDTPLNPLYHSTLSLCGVYTA